MYLFEAFGGWCNAVKRLFYQMKDKSAGQEALKRRDTLGKPADFPPAKSLRTRIILRAR